MLDMHLEIEFFLIVSSLAGLMWNFCNHCNILYVKIPERVVYSSVSFKIQAVFITTNSPNPHTYCKSWNCGVRWVSVHQSLFNTHSSGLHSNQINAPSLSTHLFWLFKIGIWDQLKCIEHMCTIFFVSASHSACVRTCLLKHSAYFVINRLAVTGQVLCWNVSWNVRSDLQARNNWRKPADERADCSTSIMLSDSHRVSCQPLTFRFE